MNRQRGITLIEVMIALLIMALLMSVVYSGLRSGMQIVGRVSQRAQQLEDRSAATQLLRRQLEHAQRTSVRDRLGKKVVVFRGLPDRLEFVAPLPSYRLLDSLYHQTFHVDDGALLMHYRPDRSADTAGETQRLFDGLGAMQLSYFGSKNNKPNRWHTHWVNEIQLPVAVRLQFLPASDQDTLTGEDLTPSALTLTGWELLVTLPLGGRRV